MTDPAAAPAHTVRLEVELGRALQRRALHVSAQWLGEPRALVLSDDGAVFAEDVPGDGIFVAEISGAPALLLPLELRLDGPQPVVWSGVVRLFGPEDSLRFGLSPEGRLERSLARPAGAVADPEAPRLVAGYGWAALVLIFVLALALRCGSAR